jgi:DNA-binding transcriptional LysR family regulator
MSQGHIADLNLLRVLEVLLEEENVSRAAARLGVTQSAISRSLARLRRLFGDELFLRTGRGMRPTLRALELRPRVHGALTAIDRLVLESARFEPRLARRRFRIAAVDYAQAVLLAPLLRALAEEAPGIDWELLPSPRVADPGLESGEVDLSIAPRRPSGVGIVWSKLLDEDYTSIVWSEHPLRTLGSAAFARLPHVLVAPWGQPRGVVDDVLAAGKERRRIAVQVPTFLMLPHLLVGTERIATVPRRIAALLVAAHPLRTLEPPVSVPGFTLHQGWHELHRHDPGHAWLRSRLAETARRLS